MFDGEDAAGLVPTLFAVNTESRRGGNQERRPQGTLGHGEDQQDLLHRGERRPAGGHGPAEETKVKNNSKLNI